MSKNIQIIDGSVNSSFDVFEISEEHFNNLFPNNTDVAFLKDFPGLESDTLFWREICRQKVNKKTVCGIHGTLHLNGSSADAFYFPNRLESDGRSYSIYMPEERTWINNNRVQCVVKFNDTKIAKVIVDLDLDTATLIEGGFGSLPHNPFMHLLRGTTHEQKHLEAVKESVKLWAETNR